VPHKKISEFRSKVMVTDALQLPYEGLSIDTQVDIKSQLAVLQADQTSYVVKVDQAIKGRFKKGLVLLDVGLGDLPDAIASLQAKGYRWLIVEPQVIHFPAEERYMALGYDQHGLKLAYSRDGGVDIESNAASVNMAAIDDQTYWPRLANMTGLSELQLRSLVALFEDNHVTLLEINPYIVRPEGLHLLDLAIEVDDAAELLVKGWTESDFRNALRNQTPEERSVEELAAKSPASFKLEVINPNGAIFLLLSGGGASITVADEIYARGYGGQMANYGEYSGNPNHEETYIYTLAILDLLLKSDASKKVLFIGGAVANFTDIASTFAGIIQALNEREGALQMQDIRVFVRRGGPRQEIGLAQIRQALAKHDLLGAVYDPSTPLTDVVKEALEGVDR
jgi:ATP-citrate lyase beta-subunit